MTHTDACKKVMLWLSEIGARHVVLRPVGMFRDARGNPRMIGTKGEADVQAVMPGGRSVAVEIKMGRDDLRSEQKIWRANWILQGGLYHVARFRAGGNPDTVKAALVKALAPNAQEE